MLGSQNKRGIFLDYRAHKIEITGESMFMYDFYVSEPLITFTGSRYGKEGRRIEKVLIDLEKYLN